MTSLPSLPSVPPTAAPLPSGRSIPLMGFGTWRLSGAAATNATVAALELGYRHVDTATIYGNEREIGAALRASPLERDSVFITTKLPPDHAGRERETLEQSLEMLGIEAVDLWLVHWPPDAAKGLDVWRAFIAALQDGLVRDIGVSNYSLAQLDEVAEATGTMPAVNQIKWSAYHYDGALLEGHRERGVVVEGYSGLKGGTLQDPVVLRVAQRAGRSPAQVLVRWQLDHGVVALPKSSNPGRIAENADVDDLVLSESDVAAIDGLSQL